MRGVTPGLGRAGGSPQGFPQGHADWTTYHSNSPQKRDNRSSGSQVGPRKGLFKCS